MVFIKHNSLKSDIFLNPIFIPCFSGSRFFRVQVFLGPGPGSGFRFQKQPCVSAYGFNHTKVNFILLYESLQHGSCFKRTFSMIHALILQLFRESLYLNAATQLFITLYARWQPIQTLSQNHEINEVVQYFRLFSCLIYTVQIGFHLL